MPDALIADVLVVVHFAFILFVVFGALLVALKPALAWLHLPCLVWGSGAMISGAICPLTPLEIEYRLAAGQAPYSGTFIAHYIEPIIYPPGMSRLQQVLIGVLFLVLNGSVYAWLVLRWRKRKSQSREKHP